MIMKKFVYLTLIVLFAFILSSCAKTTPQPVDEATPPPADERIQPGDKIGDFLITTSDDEDVFYTTNVHCPFDQATMTETCEIPVGTKVNSALGAYGDDYSGKNLEVYWSDQTYEMTIEGRPVNLQAFGFIDITNPMVGKMRLWNVVIVTDKPGTITIDHSGEIGGESQEGTNVLIYTAP
jgi:hypothetical protein